jgi:capsular exopolysaccharide synthesis family protein
MTVAPSPDALDALPQERSRRPGLAEYARVLWRYRWGVLGLAAIAMAVAAFKAYLEVPIFRASSTLLIEREAARFVSIDPVYQSAPMWDFGEYYQTQYEILRSRPIAERVVRQLGLDAFQAAPDARRGFSLARLLGNEAEMPAAPSEAEARQRAIATVLGGVSIQPVRNSQLVRVVFDHPDPELAARLANALPQAYIEETLEGKLQMTQSASNWLVERLSGLRQKLEESERALQEFRDRERLIDVKGVDSLAAQQVGLASERLAEARRERVDKEALFRQVEAARRGGQSLESVAALLEYPLVEGLKQTVVDAERDVRELAQRYGPRHPRMIEAQSKLETGRSAYLRQLDLAADAVVREYQTARSREGQIAGELGSAKGEVADINRKQYELTRLDREVAANRELYEQFQTRFKETAAAGGVQNANARVVEPAMVPTAPISPDHRRIIVVGLLVGLALGVALAFLLDHLDNALRTPEDVERRLALSVLGVLPRLEAVEGDERAPQRHFAAEPKSGFSEAVRTIRTGVLLSAIDEPHKRLLVTSSTPGEGKTTLAVNLALALGQMKRVLLIDADMRRPAVHRGLPVEIGAPGLSQFVAGAVEFEQCLVNLPDSSVAVMPAGAIPPNPQELLSSRRFSDALDALSQSYDHIIIDCAPACAVSDALVLSRLAHAVLYVIKADATPWQLADEGLRRLRRVGAPLLGAVLNQVTARRRGYGYGRYYYGDAGYHDYGYAARRD